nr:hypothetical protein [Acidobacteriota bacterium]
MQVEIRATRSEAKEELENKNQKRKRPRITQVVTRDIPLKTVDFTPYARDIPLKTVDFTPYARDIPLKTVDFTP